MDKFEASILDGSAFRGPRTPSPTRSHSTASSSSSSPSSSPLPAPSSSQQSPPPPPPRSTGPQTGPKGVIADKKYSLAVERQRKQDRLEKTRQRLQQLALVAGTSEEQEKLARRERRYLDSLKDIEKRQGHLDREEENECDDEDVVLERLRARRLAELKGEINGADDNGSSPNALGKLEGWKEGKSQPCFGHLRETDERGYVRAVEGVGHGEREAKAVVVHIYSKLVPACNQLTSALTSLARLHPSTKFIQVRALAINFGLPPTTTKSTQLNSVSDDSDEEDETESSYRLRQLEKEESMAEVLPTLLIYKEGDLVGNLVRVDLEEGWKDGSEKAIGALLKSHDAI